MLFTHPQSPLLPNELLSAEKVCKGSAEAKAATGAPAGRGGGEAWDDLHATAQPGKLLRAEQTHRLSPIYAQGANRVVNV